MKKKGDIMVSKIIGWAIGIVIVFVVIFIVYRLLAKGGANVFTFGT